MGHPRRARRTLAFAFGVVALTSGAPMVGATDYQVELLVFTHTGGAASTAGHDTEAPPDLQAAIDPDGQAAPAGFAGVPDDELQLADAAAELRRSGRYEVLKHLAWRQPGLGARAARAVRVQGGKDYTERFPPPEDASAQPSPEPVEQLDGTVELVERRFLHLHANLVLREPGPAGAGERLGLNELRLQQNRRMRSDELHYIDHPRLGMLVQVTPIVEDEEEADEDKRNTDAAPPSSGASDAGDS